MKRICFVGASTVEGLGDETSRGWVGRLAHREKETIVSYNLGVRGQTLEQIHSRANQECSSRILDSSQGGIVFCSGVNDLARLKDASLRTPKEQSATAFKALILEMKKIAPIIVLGPFPINEKQMPFYSAASGLSLDFKNNDISNADKDYNLICSELSVPYISVFSELQKSTFYIEGLKQHDGLHSNGDGYQVIADLVALDPAWEQLIK